MSSNYTMLKACDVDWRFLARETFKAMQERGISFRGLEREIGVHNTQISNLRHGQVMSSAGLASLLAWLYPDNIPAWIITPARRVTNV